MEPISRTVGLFFAQQSEGALSTLFVAWAMNRWRLRRVNQSRLARG
jgi:hypothetical protein